jgi:hypothetical protein
MALSGCESKWPNGRTDLMRPVISEAARLIRAVSGRYAGWEWESDGWEKRGQSTFRIVSITRFRVCGSRPCIRDRNRMSQRSGTDLCGGRCVTGAPAAAHSSPRENCRPIPDLRQSQFLPGFPSWISSFSNLRPGDPSTGLRANYLPLLKNELQGELNLPGRPRRGRDLADASRTD